MATGTMARHRRGAAPNGDDPVGAAPARDLAGRVDRAAASRRSSSGGLRAAVRRRGRRGRGDHEHDDHVLAAIDRADVADYVEPLFTVYIVLIFIRDADELVPRIPYNRDAERVLDFVRDVTDPYLNMFRKFVPMVRIGPGALDLSPIVAVIVLSSSRVDRRAASIARLP